MSAVLEKVHHGAYRGVPRLHPMLPVGNSRYCLCRGCAQYFLSVRAFEKHRVVGLAEKRACLPTPRMPEAGLALDARGYWRLPRRPMTARDKLRLRRVK